MYILIYMIYIYIYNIYIYDVYDILLDITILMTTPPASWDITPNFSHGYMGVYLLNTGTTHPKYQATYMIFLSIPLYLHIDGYIFH